VYQRACRYTGSTFEVAMARKVKRNKLAEATEAGSRNISRHQKTLEPLNNRVALPKIPTSALKGMIRPPRRKVSLADMDEAIANAIIEEYRS
jgi:hypothetical protein